MSRHCPYCDWKFEGENGMTEYADHSTTHNPSPAQWASAYELIQEAKKRKKIQSGEESISR